MPVLFAYREDRFGFRFELGELAVLGRSPECDLILFDRATSRVHAKIIKSEQGYVLEDLGSTNGTLHNESPVHKPVILKPNDEIRVGQEIFLFDPDLDVAVGRFGAILIVGQVEEAPEGMLARTPEPDPTNLDRNMLLPLHKLATALSCRPETVRILKQTAYALEKLLGATRVGLMWPESGEAHRQTALLLRPPGRILVLPKPLVNLVLESNQAALWPNVLRNLQFSRGERSLDIGSGPVMAVPLKAYGDRLGLLYVESDSRSFGEKDLNFLIALAGLIGPALVNASLVGQLNNRLNREEKALQSGSDFLGNAPEIKTLLATASQMAATDAKILILGELGTGKEVLAKRIHALSHRRRGAFIQVNCAALSPLQIESTLFGQEAGALSEEGSVGFLEEADGGTIFLKNVDHLPLSVQVDVLRALEEGVIYRVGSSRPHPVNFRTISSSNEDLEALVDNGEFRDDLLKRLSGVTLTIPPLRDLKDDIGQLVKHFLAWAARERGLTVPELDPAAKECLRAYPWPGNVGELKNVADRLVMFTTGERIMLEDLPMDLRLAGDVFQTPEGERMPDTLIEVEKSLIRRALARARGSENQAARVLGLNDTMMGQLIRRYDIILDQNNKIQETGTNG